MKMSRIYAIILRQFYLMRGNPSRVFPIFAWVAVDIISWGFITEYLNSVSASGINFVPMLLGALLLWNFLTRTMQGVTMTFFEDVWSRNFLNLFSTPMKISEYIIGLVFSSIITSLIGLAVMLVLATMLFGFSMFAYGIMMIPFLLILFMFGIAMGIMACGVVLRLGPASEWFIWPIPAIIAPFVGVFYPISVLPSWMQYISKLLPPSYVFEGVRAIVSRNTFSPDSLILGGALAVLYIMLAYWFFTCTYKRAIKTGLIARYSAESLS